MFEEANRKKAEAAIAKQQKTKKARGRNKISKKLQRKQKNVIDSQTVKLKTTLEQQKAERLERMNRKRKDIETHNSKHQEVKENKFNPLGRFERK